MSPIFAARAERIACDSTGPLETAELSTVFAIAPTPADWAAG